ncbi:hypothetical protein [Schaalia sp. lx-100]|uniref:hypothetical protein n=1 Tax=Schaalia sp. lx-100 TaxID=2899081 RepID=UPI001E640815|nr:hypothetical protein [Schaalia sp. lx-100]MCD4557451.1 hypothetical protein [Schaalia sp. lx-100]
MGIFGIVCFLAGICGSIIYLGDLSWHGTHIRKWLRDSQHRQENSAHYRAHIQNAPVLSEKNRGARNKKSATASHNPHVLYAHVLRKRNTFNENDIALLCSEVAARLYSGACLVDAWKLSWQRLYPMLKEITIDEDGVPSIMNICAGIDVHVPARKRIFQHLLPVQSTGFFGRFLPSARAGPHDISLRIPLRRRQNIRAAARTVRAACRYTTYVGAPVAQVLEMIASGIDDAQVAHDARAIACAGATTSIRIMTALPCIGMSLAYMIGADPVASFADGGAGTISACAGIFFLAAGWKLFHFLMKRNDKSFTQNIDIPIVCDLAVAGLQSGASVPRVLEALGYALEDEALRCCGKSLRLGLPWWKAWEGADTYAQSLGKSLEIAWCDGASPVSLVQRCAEHIRSRRLVNSRLEAERIGVRVVVPVAALLLPAFIALGVMPIVLFLMKSGFEDLSFSL